MECESYLFFLWLSRRRLLRFPLSLSRKGLEHIIHSPKISVPSFLFFSRNSFLEGPFVSRLESGGERWREGRRRELPDKSSFNSCTERNGECRLPSCTSRLELNCNSILGGRESEEPDDELRALFLGYSTRPGDLTLRNLLSWTRSNPNSHLPPNWIAQPNPHSTNNGQSLAPGNSKSQFPITSPPSQSHSFRWILKIGKEETHYD